ncbi:MAG: hypothetical protein H0U23_02965 [Blastocatellia bacterium]|nr:hypothetical protein [Blastocatellia bacterium]
MHDAQDLTQDFFVMVLKGNFLQQADHERGRFRSLLLKSLQNFLHDAHDKTHALERGGEMQIVSWDEWMAEAPSRLTLPAAAFESWPAERVFDVRLRYAAAKVPDSRVTGTVAFSKFPRTSPIPSRRRLMKMNIVSLRAALGAP